MGLSLVVRYRHHAEPRTRKPQFAVERNSFNFTLVTKVGGVTSDDGVDELVARPEVGRIYQARRRVRLADSSPGGRLRLDAAARYLQDIANDDSRDAGTPNPTAWVARRTVIRVDAFPRYLDMLSLRTWCSGLGPRWAERRYSTVADEPGDGRFESATLWVHIDMATMKPIGLPDGFAEQFGAAAGGRRVRARQQLPSRPPDGPVTTSPWPLRFVDFDVLGHVNNSVYWAMVEQQMADQRSVRAPMTVTLEHHDGIAVGDEVVVTAAQTADGFDLWVRCSDDRLAAVVRATTA